MARSVLYDLECGMVTTLPVRYESNPTIPDENDDLLQQLLENINEFMPIGI